MSRNPIDAVAMSANLIESVLPHLAPPVTRQPVGSVSDDEGLDLAFIAGFVVGAFAAEDDE